MHKIGIWVASSPVKSDLILKGTKKLKDLGIPFKIAKLSKKFATQPLSKSHFFLAGPDDAKISAFFELWNDQHIKHIFCVRGGYGALRLLPDLDKKFAKARKPKIKKMLWGYSDTTIVQFYLFQKFKLPWMHSPMISSQGFLSPNTKEKKAWDNIFSGRLASSQFTLVKLSKKGITKPHRLLLLGGNLSSMVSMFGSPWEPNSTEPFVLFIEDIFEEGRRLDRLLIQLSNSRFFKNCRGVLCGHFTQCPDYLPILKSWAAKTEVPVYMKVPAGHESPNIPLQMGVKILLKPSKGGLFVEVPSPKFVP